MHPFWRNLSVAKKLYAVVGLMALLIASELFTLLFAMQILSSVRAFVVGEGLWTKSQKDGIHSLYQYALDGDEDSYKAFQSYLSIPAGDHLARMELLRPNPRLEIVRAGFIQGGNHPDDIDGMIQLLTRFHKVSFIHEALVAWSLADENLTDLQAAAINIQQLIQHGPGPGSSAVAAALGNIARINARLTELEIQFSSALGAGSRWLERLLMTVLTLTVLTVEGTGLILAFRFSRTLGRSLKELHQTAEAVGKGNFAVRAPVRSRDELGQVAMALNHMVDDLASNAAARTRLNQELETRVEQRTWELKEAKEAADLANSAKAIFLANMSHEIRTPLGAVLGFSELLVSDKLTPAEKREYGAAIQRNGELLSNIISDILDLSKVDAGKMEADLQDVALSEIISDLSAILLGPAREKGVHLDFQVLGHCDDVIHTDALRLRQILINIIGNAVKFTEKGSVTVQISALTPDDGTPPLLRFLIKDSGCGIGPNQVQHLFAPFSQADSSTRRQFGGTGLGLILSRKLAQLLGGNLVLEESAPGKGSTFSVAIAKDGPTAVVAESPRRHSRTRSQASQRIDGLNVLLVDDALDNQLLVSHILRRAGARVEVASNGQEAVTMATSATHDVVLMDLQMPIVDGYEALAQLQAKGYATPIIALTAHALAEERQKCLDAGFADHVTKPVKSHLLLASILQVNSAAPPPETLI